jgi:hypothetical protein
VCDSNLRLILHIPTDSMKFLGNIVAAAANPIHHNGFPRTQLAPAAPRNYRRGPPLARNFGTRSQNWFTRRSPPETTIHRPQQKLPTAAMRSASFPMSTASATCNRTLRREQDDANSVVTRCNGMTINRRLLDDLLGFTFG